MTKRAAHGSGCVFQPTYTVIVAGKRVTKTSSTWWYKLPDGTKGKCTLPDGTPAKTEREARECLLRKLGQVHAGLAPKASEKSLRYGDLREDLLRYMRTNRLRSLETLTDGRESVKGLTKLDEFFGFTTDNPGMKMSEFSAKMWEEDFIAARRREGVSDATIVNSAKLLRQMFSLAVTNKRIAAKPQIACPTPPKPRETVLYKEQFDQVLGTNGMNKRYHRILRFLFYQGVRIGEALNILWKQIDLDITTFRPDPRENKTEDDTPKPLHEEVIRALGEEGAPNEFVFPEARSEGNRNAKKFEKEFRAAMLRLGFGKFAWQCGQCREVKDGNKPENDAPAIMCPKCKEIPMQWHYVGATPHSLRASCIVFYLESGMSETAIMKITGHKDIKVFRGYARLSQDSLKNSMDAAEEMRRKSLAEIERARSNRKRRKLAVA